MVDDPFGWIGRSIDDKYDVEAVVGEGGFAVVYRGHHRGFGESVAIKCLKIPRKLDGEERERFLASFLAEGKLLHRLSRADAGIVQALDVGAATSPSGTWTPFLVLEWLEGQTLEEELRERRHLGRVMGDHAAQARDGRLDDGRVELSELLPLLEPAVRALGTAHAQGIAHRDVKPANLFVVRANGARRRTCKVLDFGIAKVLSDASDLARAYETTGAAPTAFTPHYGAPEQFDRRFGATGPWTDVFALGLIVVEAVTGKRAMEGDAAQLFVAASNVAHRPTPRGRGVDAGDAVEAVLERALAVTPSERYASAPELWSALAAAAAHAPTVASFDASRLAGAPSRVPSTRRDGGSAAPGQAEEGGAALAPSAAAPEAPGALEALEESDAAPLVLRRAEPGAAPSFPERARARDLVDPAAPPRRAAIVVVASLAALAGGAYIAARAIAPDRGARDPAANDPAIAAIATNAAPVPSASSVDPVDAGPATAACEPDTYCDERTGFKLAPLDGFVERSSGVLDGADGSELRLDGGKLDAKTTLLKLFNDARGIDLDRGWISTSEMRSTSYLVAGFTGPRRGESRPFCEGAVATDDRYATYHLTFPPGDAGADVARCEGVARRISFRH